MTSYIIITSLWGLEVSSVLLGSYNFANLFFKDILSSLLFQTRLSREKTWEQYNTNIIIAIFTEKRSGRKF